MELKCPVCGKKYRHDSKICHECEDHSIYSGLTDIGDRDNHKWNCSIFLDIDTIAFKSSKIRELIKDLTPEPNNFAIHENTSYDWNCKPINKSKLDTKNIQNTLTIKDFSTFMKSKKYSSLIYE
ncbi:MAG: hypothetical protein ACFFG0_43640 [Candidatus Thorarchaeota archaeon]